MSGGGGEKNNIGLNIHFRNIPRGPTSVYPCIGLVITF